MATQALARCGERGRDALCLLLDEAHSRPLEQFSVEHKIHLLWALAKSKVVHASLCRRIAHDLATECCTTTTRTAIHAGIWALAVLHSALDPPDDALPKVFAKLCTTHPWQGAAPYETANSAWAVGELRGVVDVDVWVSLSKSVCLLIPSQCSLHELCNLLQGFAVCPKSVEMGATLSARLAAELTSRLPRAGAEGDGTGIGKGDSETLSAHDRQALSRAIARAERPLPVELARLAETLGCTPMREAVDSSIPVPASLLALDRGEAAEPVRVQAECLDTCDAAHCQEICDVALLSHIHGHCHGHGQGQGEEPACVHLDILPHACDAAHCSGQAGDVSVLADSHDDGHGHGHSPGDGYGHCRGHVHGQAMEPNHVVYAEQATHLVKTSKANCLPELYEGGDANRMRLNTQCNFHGHCIQLKNTFIHVDCTTHIGRDGEEDCMICRHVRSRSCGSLRVADYDEQVFALGSGQGSGHGHGNSHRKGFGHTQHNE